jgi:carboxymethylenebutenolidase
LLHGREEISVFPRLYQGYIDQLSTEGFEVCTLLYYTEEDKTIMTGNDRALRVQRYHVRLKNWVEKAKQALTVLSERPEVDSSRLGILGFSQGAFVAMGVAASDNRIKAAAEVYGGMPKEFLNTASRLPAVLVLHGNADRVVPVTEAYALEELLKERSVHYRMKIYEGAKHGYDSEPASGIAKDSYRQVVQFFLNELGHGG